MKFGLALVATMSWMGCGIDTALPGSSGGSMGDDGTADPGSDPADSTDNPNDPGEGTGPITEVSGRIKANTTWMNTIHVIGNTTIDPGVTVTVLPGTTVSVSSGFAITASGVLDIQGTKASRVVFRSATPGEYWSEIYVPNNGTLKATYLVQTGGGLHIVNTGKATLVDSQFSHAGGDLLTMSSGSLDMSYSAIGLETGRDTTHCNMHVTGLPNLKVTHSNLSAAAYGLMFYGGKNADFTYDNWFGNTYDLDTEIAYQVTGNFSFSYFGKGNPNIAGITATNMATARIADAGVR